MKTILYSSILVCIGLISLFTLYSCQRPDGSDDKPCVSTTENYYLSDAEKNTLPYTGFDTIRMVSNLGDTIQCIGNGKQFFKTYEFVPYIKPSCGNTGTEKYYEAYKITFIDSTRKEDIEINHYFYHSVKYYSYAIYDDVTITFKENTWHISDFQISDPTSRTYLGDLELNGNMYSSISKTPNSDIVKDDTTSFTLLNRKNGIILIQINPNEKWTILN
jgi:hypothetical protein